MWLPDAVSLVALEVGCESRDLPLERSLDATHTTVDAERSVGGEFLRSGATADDKFNTASPGTELCDS